MHYNHKAMRDFATRLSRELDLRLVVIKGGSKRTHRYRLIEWDDVYGAAWVDINIGIYDKRQQERNMLHAPLGGGDYHEISNFSESTQKAIREARRQRRTPILVELAVRTITHQCYKQIASVVTHEGLLDEGSFKTVCEWLGEIRKMRYQDKIYTEQPYFADTLKLINQREYDALVYGDYLIKVGKDDKFGLIDLYGNTICDLKYDYLEIEKEYIIAKLNDKYGCINSRNEVIIPFEYDKLWCFEDDYLVGRIDKKQGVINLKNEVIIPFEYDNLWYFEVDYLVSIIDKKRGLINLKNKVCITPKYDSIKSIDENGVVVVKLGEKYGCVSLNDSVIAPMIYDSIDYFSDGLAPVSIGGKWGYIDMQGKLVIECQFDWAFPFMDGSAIVGQDNDRWYIDKSGHYLEKYIHDDDDIPF